MIKIQEYDKAAIFSPRESGDMSIQIPKTPLGAEEAALSTSRPASPRDRKRKGDHGYFTKFND